MIIIHIVSKLSVLLSFMAQPQHNQPPAPHLGCCSNITWASWWLKSQLSLTSLYRFTHIKNNENMKAVHYWPKGGNPLVTVASIWFFHCHNNETERRTMVNIWISLHICLHNCYLSRLDKFTKYVHPIDNICRWGIIKKRTTDYLNSNQAM